MAARPDPATAWSSPHALLPLDPNAKFHDYRSNPSLVMAFIHDLFIRGLNCMIYYAPRIRPNQRDAFVKYCILWVGAINEHHHIEETIQFPAYEKKLGKGALSVNLVQHEQFTPHLKAFDDWLKSVQAKKAEWNLETFQKHVESFDRLLVTHLTSELDTISPAKIEAKMTKEDIDEVNKILARDVPKIAKPEHLVIYVCNHALASHPEANCFPETPWLVSMLFRTIIYWRVSDAMQFASCDNWGRLKPLPTD